MLVRPSPLYPLFAEITSLSGVGPRNARLLETVAGGRVIDLLFHLPHGFVDRRAVVPITRLVDHQVATVTATVDAHSPPPPQAGRGVRPYRVHMSDDSGSLDLVYFRARADYLQRSLPVGARRAVSGTVEVNEFGRQMIHPDHVVTVEDLATIAVVEPVYPLTAGLSAKVLRKVMLAALATAPDLDEWLDPALMTREGWSGWRAALERLHRPSDVNTDETERARRRLAYDEVLSNQLALAIVRQSQRQRRGRSLIGSGALVEQLIAALPFNLTGDQLAAWEEIRADMASPFRMLRLVQGDVGSGKTAVSMMAMAGAVEIGAQAALMAPTEILARQHFEGIAKVFAPLGIRVELLTGRERGRNRATLLEALQSGEIRIVIGTHALFQDDVQFHDLGLVVIDEQHRFGVRQRLQLSAKGRDVDVLVMTATPIPRTLTLTAYGDMDVTRIREKPPGRQPITTRLISGDRLPELLDRLGRQLDQGVQAFWICPLIEETADTGDSAAVEARFADLRDRFGDWVGIVHGRMPGHEKDAAMAAFTAGETRLLVATTAIEVGVDVPNATIMIIENAERFGLAQLHQLRGRVGRGAGASTCLLMHDRDLSETARQRLAILRETEDGFRIAEEDLAIRGAGEVLGTRQSGLPAFRLADLDRDSDLIEIARDEAELLLARDTRLEGQRGKALKTLLYLFERDAAVKTLHSG